MAPPDIPAAKRAGLPVDIERLATEGDGWLTPEERYALKTYGVCAQEQEHVFMVRVRVPGGVLPTEQARAVARLGRRDGSDWLHLTTRQNLELHWVEDVRVPRLLADLQRAGLSTRSACGHTMRNVMSSEDAGVALDEPFDCLPDARAVSDALLARSAELNSSMPSRINIAFGGSPRCREDALINDAGFVSVVIDGEAGYELWAGGSLGKAPSLSVQLSPFVRRADVLAAAEALVDVFVAHGSFDTPAKGRMKFVVSALGPAVFRAAWDQAFAAARARPHPEPVAVGVLGAGDRVAILERIPTGGWSVGVRP
ncbi:MAG: nitrite/sulfite reductase, partial [Actinomycetota bacterium]|nr:nitrite/sulfite reductase [Actinomycetota bacterium]